MKPVFLALLAALWFCLLPSAQAADASPLEFIESQLLVHGGETGAYVLERGEEALQARAWLADHARSSIEVQYFIWSSDNIGTLAAEALLRAAERGVKVRVIVDDILIDAPDKLLLALARHPEIEIRIYNPKHKVGTPLHKRLLNVATDFRGVNQRMHDKTFIVDGRLAITGGRNMADEYFDYDQEYNFRDRDVLLLGEAVLAMRASFENFWESPLAAPVESLYDGIGLMQKRVVLDEAETARLYQGLHDYAAAPENFAPEVRAAIADTPRSFPALARAMSWGRVDFIHDLPGKNGDTWLHGGGLTAETLAGLVAGARSSVLIQSPYLVLSDRAIEVFRNAIARGVRVRISTNSLASTDNIQAYSGYRNQRKKLLALGLEIHEYRPDPAIQLELMPRARAASKKRPIFAIHAKSMVVDSKLAFVGTYNLDPRSENLNTEVGVVLHDAQLARSVEQSIEVDMAPGNSWSAKDNPDRHASLWKRSRVRLWQQVPIKPLL